MSAEKADSTLMPELDEGTKTNVNSGDEVHKGRGKTLNARARRGGYYGLGMAEGMARYRVGRGGRTRTSSLTPSLTRSLRSRGVRGSRQLRGIRRFEGRRIKHQDVTRFYMYCASY